jgi:hypothetical protein
LVAVAWSGEARASETTCATACPSSCVLGQLREGACDVRGECIQLPARACAGGFACANSGECATTCSIGRFCASGYACDEENAKCVPTAATCNDGRFLSSDQGVSIDCAPYACTVGARECKERCASDGDCSEGHACNSGRCGPPPPDNSADADAGAQSCTVAPARGGGEGSYAWTIGLGGLVVLGLVLRLRR